MFFQIIMTEETTQMPIEVLDEAIISTAETYSGIEPTKKYDRTDFVPHYKALDKITTKEQQLAQDPNNEGLLGDLEKLIYGKDKEGRDKPGFSARGLNAMQIRATVADSRGKAEFAMSEYVAKNFDEFFDKIGNKDLEGLVYQIPFTKTDDEKDNQIKGIIGQAAQLAQIRGMGDSGQRIAAMRAMVAQQIENSTLNPVDKARLLKDFIHSDSFVIYQYNAIAVATNATLVKYGFAGEKINRNKIKALIKDSLKKVYDVLDSDTNRETNAGARQEVYDNTLKPIYLAVAKAAYGAEKGAFDMDSDHEGQKRKKDRKDRGIRE